MKNKYHSHKKYVPHLKEFLNHSIIFAYFNHFTRELIHHVNARRREKVGAL